MTTEHAAEEKSQARARVRARRRARTPHEAESAAAGLQRAVRAYVHRCRADDPGLGTVLAFLPFGAEPPLEPALASLCAEGFRVLVPRSRPGRKMEWVRWAPGTELVPSDVVPMPEPDGPAEEPPANSPVLVPALALGDDGVRLGQGGGFYDAFLADRPRPLLAAGVVYDDELGLPGLPADPWDATLQWAVTPGGVHRLCPPQAGNPGSEDGARPQKGEWRLAE